MQDRLQDLHLDVSYNKLQVGGYSDPMPDFNEKVMECKKLLTGVELSTQQIKELKDKFTRATTTSEENQINKSLTLYSSNSVQSIKKIKTILEQLAEDISTTQQLEEKYRDHTELRIKKQIHQSLATKTSELIKTFQVANSSFKQGVQNKVARQVKIIDPSISDDRLQDYIDGNEVFQQFFNCFNKSVDGLIQRQINKQDQISVELMNHVSDIQDKFNSIKALQRDVENLFELQQTLALMVYEQGELIDNIEVNLNKARHHVKDALKYQQQAKAHHQSARKKMCCIICCFTIILAIVLVPVVIKLN